MAVRNASGELAAHLDSSRSIGERPRRRYQPTAIYLLAERLKRRGIRLWVVEGPWRTIRRQVHRRDRTEPDAIPVVTNGRVEVMVDTMEHAADLSGVLNWAGVDDLQPVPELTPPSERDSENRESGIGK
jgi:hypothetical protein